MSDVFLEMERRGRVRPCGSNAAKTHPFKNVVRAESALMGLLEEYHVKREIYHGELESICAIVRGYQRMRGRVNADAAHVEVVGGASV